MWLEGLSLHSLSRPATGRRPRPPAGRRRGYRPVLTHLEDRTALSNFTAATVSDLIADINAANRQGGPNTITLVAGSTFSLTAVDNTTDGATGLPVIAANDTLTIIGNGDTIERSTASGTPAFRLLDVAAQASLTLQNLTLQGGLTSVDTLFSNGYSGGAIENQGALDLNGVTVQNNISQGGGAGGGIVSGGSLTLEGGTKVQNNQALGRQWPYGSGIGSGKNGLGGGLSVGGGTVTVTNATFSGNAAQGDQGSPAVPPNHVNHGRAALAGGHGYGGAVYVGSGTVNLTSMTLSGNTAQGGAGGFGNSYYPRGAAGGNGLGAGLYVRSGTVALTTVSVSSNLAQGGQGGPSYRATGGVGGSGYGGGLFLAGGTMTLRNDTVTSNTAQAGPGGPGSLVGSPGLGEAGGLYIAPASAVCLDVFTQAHITRNTASTSYPDIFGHWTTC